MGDRRFADRQGLRWDIVVRGRREWVFEPVEDNPGPRKSVEPPGYETADPFEMSVEELQKLLDAAVAPRRGGAKNPFLD